MEDGLFSNSWCDSESEFERERVGGGAEEFYVSPYDPLSF